MAGSCWGGTRSKRIETGCEKTRVWRRRELRKVAGKPLKRRRCEAKEKRRETQETGKSSDAEREGSRKLLGAGRGRERAKAGCGGMDGATGEKREEGSRKLLDGGTQRGGSRSPERALRGA